jgi:hypothetical protein
MLALTLALAAPVMAQTPAGPQAPASTQTQGDPQTPAGTPVATPTVPMTYGTAALRDPFLPLLQPRRASLPERRTTRPRSGLAGLALADVTVKGVVRNGDTMLAILEGPDRQSFVTKVQDQLLDAEVKSIDLDGVVFLASGRQEVRKLLPSAAEVN